MTLADFARSIGVSPATARQWKRRGKIVECEGGFELIAEAQREWVGIAGRDTGVALHSAQDSQYMFDSKFRIPQRIPPPVKVPSGRVTDSAQDSRLCRREAGVGERQPESHRESCAGCEALQERVKKLEADVTVTLNAYLARLESRLTACESDNATLQRFVDGLRDRVAALEAEKAINSRMGIDLSCLETRVSELEVTSKSSNTIDSPSVHWGA